MLASPFSRRAFFLVTAMVVLGPAGVAVRSYMKSDELVHGPRSHVTPANSARARAEIPGLEEAALRTSDGLTLRGWFAPGKGRGAVIFTHGGGGADRMALLPEAAVIARHGYGVLLYDSRAAGESDGDMCSWGDREQRDVAAALDYVTARPDVDRDRVALLGFSIGGSTVALAAANDPRARAVILYATWSSLEDEMKHRAKFGPLSWGPALLRLRRSGVHVDDVDPIDRIVAIHPRPLLMIAGTDDGDTPLPVMERVFAAAGDPKELWIVQGAGHGTYYETAPAEYESRVIGFLDHALAKSEGALSTKGRRERAESGARRAVSPFPSAGAVNAAGHTL